MYLYSRQTLFLKCPVCLKQDKLYLFTLSTIRRISASNLRLWKFHEYLEQCSILFCVLIVLPLYPWTRYLRANGTHLLHYVFCLHFTKYSVIYY